MWAISGSDRGQIFPNIIMDPTLLVSGPVGHSHRKGMLLGSSFILHGDTLLQGKLLFRAAEEYVYDSLNIFAQSIHTHIFWGLVPPPCILAREVYAFFVLSLTWVPFQFLLDLFHLYI